MGVYMQVRLMGVAKYVCRGCVSVASLNSSGQSAVSKTCP